MMQLLLAWRNLVAESRCEESGQCSVLVTFGAQGRRAPGLTGPGWDYPDPQPLKKNPDFALEKFQIQPNDIYI